MQRHNFPEIRVPSRRGAYHFAAALICLLLTAGAAEGQAAESLPPAPSAQVAQASPRAAGTVSGTVVDSDGDAIAGAKVRLSGAGATPERVVTADGEGYFSFVGVPAATALTLTVESGGFATVTKQVTLAAGENAEEAEIVLPVATAADDVEVTPATQFALAEAEMKLEERQRIGGVIPNFYVTYDHDAPALSPGQKYRLAFRATIDPANFVIAGIVAGAEQATNTLPGYGQGAQGLGKRYGAALADGTVGNMLGGWFFPVLLRQDPRYFYKGTGTYVSRALYALATAFVCKGDNGRWQPNYSSVAGDISAGAVSNLYYPASDRNGAVLTIENGLLNAFEDGVGNLLQEFVFRHITPSASKP